MKRFSINRYLAYLTSTILVLLACVVSFNWFINPYGVYSSPNIAGFNFPKTYMLDQLALAKAHAVKEIKPETIILGTSRANQSIDPDHPGFMYKPVYNLALPAASVYEMLRNFQNANHVRPLKQVILFMDFFIVGGNWQMRSDFSEARFSVTYTGQVNHVPDVSDVMTSLLSTEALDSSFKTITHQSDTQPYVSGNGLWVRRQGAVDTHQNFLNDYNSWFSAYVSQQKQPDNSINSGDMKIWNQSLEYYRQIIRICHQDHIDLRIATSPCHALEWETFATLGLWPEYEQWTRQLVSINQEEAQRAGDPAFPLWDFSLYNKITTEPVPPLGQTKVKMQWYSDSSHYNRKLGDLVLDYILGYKPAGQDVPSGLGVLLTPQNIDTVLQQVWAGHEQYAQTHPDAVAEIKQQFQKYLSTAAESR